MVCPELFALFACACALAPTNSIGTMNRTTRIVLNSERRNLGAFDSFCFMICLLITKIWLIVKRSSIILHHLRWLRFRDHGLAEPVIQAGLGEPGVAAGHECALTQLCASVGRVRIGDHLAWVVAFAEDSSYEFVESELLWPRHFNDAVHGRSHGDHGDRARDILSCHGLDQNGCESDRVAIGRVVGDPLEE